MAKISIPDLQFTEELNFSELTRDEQEKITGGLLGPYGGLLGTVTGGTIGAGKYAYDYLASPNPLPPGSLGANLTGGAVTGYLLGSALPK